MNDADYAKERIFTPERMIAGGLFVAWIAIAFRIGGLPLAVRAFLLLMVPLAFIWVPGFMYRIAGIAAKESLAQDMPVAPSVLRVTGWAVMLGVPVAWLVFSRLL